LRVRTIQQLVGDAVTITANLMPPMPEGNLSRRRALLVLAIASGGAYAGFSTFEAMSTSDQRIWVVVFIGAAISSIAGFAFSALTGAALFQISSDTLYAVQVMLIASIAIQAYSVWQLRAHIKARSLAPFFAGGAATVLPGVLLLLHAHIDLYSLVLGAFLIAYALFMLAKPSFRLPSDSRSVRFVIGALSGVTGALAAFPGAFITIWCGAQGWDKRQQRAIYQPFILGMQLLTLGALSMLQPQHALQPDTFKFVLPAAIGGYLGLRVFERMSTHLFNRIVAGFLLISGLALLARVF